jgi:hypothetical protein
MKKLKMLETVAGATKGDVIVFMDDAEAAALIEAKKAELADKPVEAAKE